MRTCPRLALLLSPVLALLLVQGGGAFHASTHDLETTLADLTIQGALVDDQVGWEVASGDFNDDGIGDVLVGARQADGPSDSRGNAGDAYIILGPRTGTIDLFDEPADVTIYGADQNDQLGFSLAVGNVNGDQYDDIILGAYHADGQGTGTGCGVGQVGDSCDSGEAYVIFGRENLPNTIDVLAGDQDVTIYGAEDGDNLAVAVAAGDLDGDTLDDILLGADRADPSGGGDAGKAYVVYGDGSLPATIDLDGPPAGVLTVWGDDPDDRLGGSVGAGDLSGDGIADLIVSAHFADPASRLNAGEVYVIFGPQTGIINLDTASADLTVLGADAGDVLGLRVGAGDFSGDSQDDLLLGARYGDAADNLKSDTGEVYVFFGPRSGTIDLDTKVADLTVYGADDDDHLGIDLDAADVNADGTPDLVATAMHANAEGNLKPEAGEAYVVFGPRTGTVDLEQTPGDLRVLGVAEDDWLGRSLSTGDVSGDGIEDVLLGAIQADPESRSSAGEAYVLFGFASPDNTPVDGNVCVHLNGLGRCRRHQSLLCQRHQRRKHDRCREYQGASSSHGIQDRRATGVAGHLL